MQPRVQVDNTKFLKPALLIASLGCLFWSSNDLFYDFSISMSPSVTEGTITAHSYYQTGKKGGGSTDHFTLNYEFQIEGQRYSKTNFFKLESDATIEVSRESFDSLPIGSTIPVLYDSKDPSLNRPEGFERLLWLEWTFVGASAVMLFLSLNWLFPALRRLILDLFKDKTKDFRQPKER